MSPRDGRVEAALTRALGTAVTIRGRAPLSGGSINQVERIFTTAGAFVLKSNPDAPAGLFRAEAEGLEILRAAGSSLRVPAPVARADGDDGTDGHDRTGGEAFLVIEYLPPGSPRPDFDGALGRGLAQLHRSTAGRFGFPHDNFCGATPQPNPWTDRWIDFYATARLGAQLTLAARAHALSSDDCRRVGTLIERLDRWLFEPAEGPALIHGDLWTGNLHVTDDGRPALLDPAASYSHREAELGMMTLFGGFPPRIFDAYHEAFPLEPGWRDRNGLYQLYHLLNHVNLFGASYRAAAMAIVHKFV